MNHPLRAIPLFARLRDTDMERIAAAARERSYPKGTVIAFESDPEDALHVVVSGQVKIVLVHEDGREVILSTRSVGDFFGEMSLIDDAPRTSHVIAMEDATLLVLKREDFQMCLEDMPGIAIGMFRELGRRLREADERIGGLVLLDVPGRLARYLLQKADENDGVTVLKRPTHAMMAQIVGSSRETVSRTMRNLEEQNIIEVGRGRLVISNRSALEAAAGKPRTAPEAEAPGLARRRTDQTARPAL